MPNGTLCGKAAAMMLLADEAGHNVQDFQQEMIKSGDLPKGYLITDERIAKAKQLPSVAVQDTEGGAWNQNTDFGKKAWAAKAKKAQAAKA